jgi:hypothetical protein
VLSALKRLALAACVVAAGCNGIGGDGEVPSANAMVEGTATGVAFDFTPEQVGAEFAATVPTEGIAQVFLCESGCPGLGDPFTPGTRALTLEVLGGTADLRNGDVFEVGVDAAALAQREENGRVHADEAVSGEIAIHSADLREGGQIVGTFQLAMSSGSHLSGFFEAPLFEVSGPLVVLGAPTVPARSR